MNKIYWDRDKISILTNQMESVEHRHRAIQLFICLEKQLNICVAGQNIDSFCLMVNKNINHSFSTKNRLHITVMVEPTSDLSQHLQKIAGNNQCWIFDGRDHTELMTCGRRLLHNDCVESYQTFIQALYHYLGVIKLDRSLDDRIQALLHQIERCNCDDHSIATYANRVSLSE